MASEDDYIALQNKLQKLRTDRAVLKSREDEKAKQRAELEAELKTAGINVEDLPSEIIRLESEVNTHFARQSTLVSEFESALRSATQPPATAKVESPPVVVPQSNSQAVTIDI